MAHEVMLEVEDEVTALVVADACSCRVCRKPHDAGAEVHGLRAKHPDGRILCLAYCPGCAPIGTSYDEMARRETSAMWSSVPVTISFGRGTTCEDVAGPGLQAQFRTLLDAIGHDETA